MSGPFRCLFLSVVLFASAILFSCGAPSDGGALDKARFELDKCSVNDKGPCEAAASESSSVLNRDPTNVQAAMILSSALATNGGFDILKLIVDISKTTDSDQKFKTMHDAVLGTILNAGSLREAIEAMLPPIYTGKLAPGQDYYSDYYFQLGILQAFEPFILPTVLAQPTIEDPVDVNAITDNAWTVSLNDFYDADDDLVTSGINSSSSNGWDIVRIIRQNYCVLHKAEGGPGFSKAVLQDLVLCQLCIGVTDSRCPAEASALGPADFKSGKITKCSDFDYDGCANAGPTS